jgi:D-tyrosyl-tRNA(Tyr) deacylase
MIALIQRVTRARVTVADRTVGEIGPGLAALVCGERGDTDREAQALADKLTSYRVFADAEGKMNLSLRDVQGALLAVPQFTLAADTRSGTRPSFSPAAPPELGRRLFDEFVRRAREALERVATGELGAMMQVELTNDGPVTFWLRIDPPQSSTVSARSIR